MKKRTVAICAGIMALNMMAALSACESKDSGKDTPKQQEIQKEQKTEENKEETADKGTKAIEYIMTAVYLTDYNGGEMFVELKTEMPFYSTVPEGELYDEDGKKISKEDLKNGDVLEITGNGIIAESYPAQYHGIFKMQRTEKENKEYVDKYQSILEQFTPKVDPKEVPYLDVSYRQPDAIVTAAVMETGGYTWTYETENGKSETITADSAHILQWNWQENDAMKIVGNTDMELMFSKKPEEVKVIRWPLSAQMESDSTAEANLEGETVEVTESADGNPQITAEPEFIYLVTAVWENGEVQYGFQTKNREAIQ